MLRTVGDQPTLWESLLPAQALVMPAELARVDRLLDDERFFAPYPAVLPCDVGSAVDPDRDVSAVDVLEVPLPARVRDVVSGGDRLDHAGSGSVGSRSVARVPHPTTLMKITTRCGVAAIDGLNEALLAKAVEAKVLKTNRVRADTTVIEANVAYPTDSALLAKGVAKMATAAANGCRRWGWRHARGSPTGPGRCGPGHGRSTPTCGAATTTSSPRCKRINGELAGDR